MSDFFPIFDFIDIFWTPWSTPQDYIWNGKIVLMGFFVSASCGMIGSFIVVRRLALMGDAISHGILPGLVLAFIVSQSKALLPMFIGACAAGMLCNFCIEWLNKKTPIKLDSAMGLTFTSFFALGIILIAQFANNAHIDAECLLYGEIGYIPLEKHIFIGDFHLGPRPLAFMGVVLISITVLIILFYKQLMVTSFDLTLSVTLGLPVKIFHYGLMLCLAFTIVSSFESVGVILVIAMIIFPSITASFFVTRMPNILFSTIPLSAFYSIGGFCFARWFDCSIASAMVVVAMLCFFVAWLVGKENGILLNFTKPKTFSKIK